MDMIWFYIFSFILCIANCDHFKQTSLDVEYINPDLTVILPCQVNGTVRTCDWMKNGIPLVLQPGKYELHGNPSIGTCSLYIYQPKLGEDTTFFNCNPSIDYTASLISLPYRILARKGKATFDRPPFSISLKVRKNDSPIKKKVMITGIVATTTRVRWFVSGEAKDADVLFINKPREMSYIESSVEIISKVEPVLVNYCVEVKRDVLYKEIFVGAVYVIGDTYQITDFPSEPLIRILPFQIKPPKIRMFWYYKGKKNMVNDNRIIIKVKDIKDAELVIKCVDISSTPSTYLSWGLSDPNGYAEVTDETTEFKSNKSNGESISAKVKFLFPSHYIHLQCQAKNILHSGIEKNVLAVIIVRIQDACFVSPSHLNGVRQLKLSIVAFSFMFVQLMF